MPALITHHLFGEDAARRLPAELLANEEELLAFLLANQGPDPFFARFSARPKVTRACHRLATEMHGQHVVEALLAAREAVSRLPLHDQGVGRAFALGLVGHYALDSTAHPFVYAQQRALVAVLPELAERESDLHAVIESDLDGWMLWAQRGLTILDAPTPGNLARTRRIEIVGGALFSQLAAQVFDIPIDVGQYGAAVGNYELIYAVIDPADRRRTAVIARIERRLRGSSRTSAQAHRVWTSDTCPAANLACAEWTDPSSGETSTLSFPDLYFLALDRWEGLAEAFAYGDEERLRALAGGLNYEGVPEPA